MTKAAILNHLPTSDQGEWITLPPELKTVWGSIPPHAEAEEVATYIKALINWLDAIQPNVVWCQGELTATAVVWEWCRLNGARAVVATTMRDTIETTEPDGSVVKKAVFKHCRFREVPL